MSYTCKRCGEKVPHGQPLRRHVVRRRDGSIAREVPVCDDCLGALAEGQPLQLPKQRVEVLPVWPTASRRA